MSQNPVLSVVLPAYEEAANLRLLLPALHRVLPTLTPDYEIIVVDTEQPRDEAPEVCRENGARYVPRTGGRLYGDAIRTAQTAARGRYLVLMDADGSHSPDFIPKLWAHREEADLVIASRYVRGGHTENPFILIFLSLMVNISFRVVLGLSCHDVSNSFRLYRGDDLRALTLECDNFDIVEEILVKLCHRRKPFRMVEVPFTFEKRKEGQTKRDLVRFAIGYLGTLYKLQRMSRRAARS
jgi:dolichol-phosphate mannosyltransferase